MADISTWWWYGLGPVEDQADVIPSSVEFVEAMLERSLDWALVGYIERGELEIGLADGAPLGLPSRWPCFRRTAKGVQLQAAREGRN